MTEARLDKGGGRVLCARCGTELASVQDALSSESASFLVQDAQGRPHGDVSGVVPTAGGDDALAELAAAVAEAESVPVGDILAQYPSHPGPPRRDLLFGPGWRLGDDGVWAMTTRAQERWRQGKRPTFRRDPLGLGDPTTVPEGVVPVVLPLTARCPYCRLVQKLDAETLRLTPLPDALAPLDKSTPLREMMAS